MRAEPVKIGALVATVEAGGTPDRGELRDAVRWLLSVLRERAPGRSVEVRVPPYGAVQVVAGPRHTRGTPPNVVETDPVTFLLVATGRLSFADAVAQGRIAASGIRADLSAYLPLASPPSEQPGESPETGGGGEADPSRASH